MEKSFLQYLRSLHQSGLQVLPRGDAQIAERLRQAIEATRLEETTAMADSNDQQPAATSSGEDVVAVEIPAIDPQLPNVLAPSPAPRDSLTLEQKTGRLRILEEQVQQCELCPELVANRRQTVFGTGSPEARLCFLGEAPGADEDAQGEPFVGAAGQLLNRIIAACKMTREEVYILNTVKCRPPNNRNPSGEECQNCRPFLDEQLAILQPEFICCLGSVAAQQLLNTQVSVGRLRGKLHRHGDASVVVTYHPAFLLRNPDAKREVWADMKFLMREMGRPVD